MSRTVRTWAAVVAGLAVFSALVLLASLPTGTDDVDGVVPDGARLVTRSPVEDAWVLLLADSGRLRIQVAYDGPKGWLGVLLDHQPDDVVAARSATSGAGPVPALTALYGRAGGDRVLVHWADGRSQEVETEPDGSWLAVRSGVVESERVEVRDGGATVVEVAGP
jgi:hypothetical protein